MTEIKSEVAMESGHAPVKGVTDVLRATWLGWDSHERPLVETFMTSMNLIGLQ